MAGLGSPVGVPPGEGLFEESCVCAGIDVDADAADAGTGEHLGEAAGLPVAVPGQRSDPGQEDQRVPCGGGDGLADISPGGDRLCLGQRRQACTACSGGQLPGQCGSGMRLIELHDHLRLGHEAVQVRDVLAEPMSVAGHDVAARTEIGQRRFAAGFEQQRGQAHRPGQAELDRTGELSEHLGGGIGILPEPGGRPAGVAAGQVGQPPACGSGFDGQVRAQGGRPGDALTAGPGGDRRQERNRRIGEHPGRDPGGLADIGLGAGLTVSGPSGASPGGGADRPAAAPGGEDALAHRPRPFIRAAGRPGVANPMTRP
nr:hypothetical protein GCM10023233_22170 [Brevibacterium otitidis]